MSLILYIALLMLLCYAGLLLWLSAGYLATPFFRPAQLPELPVSIIICARNEEANIAACLRSVLGQAYDPHKIQLIVIDDGSSDKTRFLAEQILSSSSLSYQIIANTQQQGKKRSITRAMGLVIHEHIIVRDADTFTRSDRWLRTISDCFQSSGARLIIGPLTLTPDHGLLGLLQNTENQVLTVAACGSSFYRLPFLCSGANLMFTRRTFEDTQGYSSHLDLASGDDVFFLEEVRQLEDSRIVYLKSPEALVCTYPAGGLKALISQKVRWASKFRRTRNPLNFILAFLVFSVNLAWLICAFSLSDPGLRTAALVFILFKWFIDFLLLFLASGFIKNKSLLWFSLPVSLMYPLYACVVGLAALFVKPRWK